MRHSRFVSLTFVCSALLFAPLGVKAAPTGEAVKLVRVWPSYRDAASFTRLGEYFGGAPDATNREALRTQPDQRAGYYWLIRTETAAARPDCQLTLDVRRAGATAIEHHSFRLDVPAGSHAVHAGLTGTDWSDPAERPVAWRLALTDSSGQPLATETSFLWETPAPLN